MGIYSIIQGHRKHLRPISNVVFIMSHFIVSVSAHEKFTVRIGSGYTFHHAERACLKQKGHISVYCKILEKHVPADIATTYSRRRPARVVHLDNATYAWPYSYTLCRESSALSNVTPCKWKNCQIIANERRFNCKGAGHI